MQALVALSMLMTVLVTGVIGVRLLLVARRTRELPELLFGIAFLGAGTGQGFGQLGQRLIWNTPGPFATTMNTIIFGVLVVATFALLLSVWRVFGPEDPRRLFTFALGSAGVCIAYVMRISGGEFVSGDIYGNGFRIYMFIRISAFCWIAIESFRYSSMLRKRVALGLADPLVANQIYLWGVTAVLSMLASIEIAYYTLELRRSPLTDPLATVAILCIVVSSVASMWFAFFPPTRYREWVRGRAASAS